MPLRSGCGPGPVLVVGATVGLGERIFFERIVNQVVERATCRFRVLSADELVGCVPCADLPLVVHYGVYGFRKQIAFIGIAQALGALEKDWSEGDGVDGYGTVAGPVGNGFGHIEARQFQDGGEQVHIHGSARRSGTRP